MGKLTRRKRRNNNHKTNNNNYDISNETPQENADESYSNLISRGIFQFVILWFIIGIAVNYMTSSTKTKMSATNVDVTDTVVENDTANKTVQKKEWKNIQIVKEEFESYHEVIKFPKVWKYVDDDTNKKILKQLKVYDVIDFTTNVNGTILKRYGMTDDDTIDKNKPKKLHEKILLSIANIPFQLKKTQRQYTVSRYDEIRRGMYVTTLFQNDAYNIDGYNGERIVHMGIDLYAPPNTKVYSFTNGVIHSFGYNDSKGDYGYVVVIEYNVSVYDGVGEDDRTSRISLWGLYGHLSKRSLDGKLVGQDIKKGGLVGYIGDTHENGGWSNPHVHFQLSRNKPKTHDMPGVVSLQDRERALIDYPDPRIVLGPLY